MASLPPRPRCGAFMASLPSFIIDPYPCPPSLSAYFVILFVTLRLLLCDSLVLRAAFLLPPPPDHQEAALHRTIFSFCHISASPSHPGSSVSPSLLSPDLPLCVFSFLSLCSLVSFYTVLVIHAVRVIFFRPLLLSFRPLVLE